MSNNPQSHSLPASTYTTAPLKMLPLPLFLTPFLLSPWGVSAQAPPASEQLTSFNSSFSLTPDQISSANLSPEQAAAVETITRFDRSQLAFGGPNEDDFYALPPLTNTTGELKPGVLLKVQDVTDPSAYAIPPNTALSRILYTTETFNGTVVPASAFILWPYQPKKLENNDGNAAPVVLWTHGTSGFTAPYAPSAHRSLWYGHEAVFTLALEGYAVVAPDYAGLGISKSWDGSDIPHQYLLSAAGAHDALFSLQAAWDAFPDTLARDYVVMGHSQGGGVAWGAAEILHSEPESFSEEINAGYKGAIAGSPTTDVFSGPPEFILLFVGIALDSIFPSFKLSDWLTPLGISRAKLFKEIEGSLGVAQQLVLTGEDVVRTDYNETSWYSSAYGAVANAGRKEFKGPLLVIQGTNDVYVPFEVTEGTVDATCEMGLEGTLEFMTLPEVGHVPALDATRPLWLKWIEDKFNGKEEEAHGCKKTTLESFLPIESYQAVGNSFTLWANKPEWSYQTFLGL